MIRFAAALATLAMPATADILCEVKDQACTQDCTPISIRFAIDPAQFVAPQNPNDPPRRQVTLVQVDDAEFAAEAIMMPGGIVGFHEDAGELGTRLMIVQADGSARLSLQPINKIYEGTCERT